MYRYWAEARAARSALSWNIVETFQPSLSLAQLCLFPPIFNNINMSNTLLLLSLVASITSMSVFSLELPEHAHSIEQYPGATLSKVVAVATSQRAWHTPRTYICLYPAKPLSFKVSGIRALTGCQVRFAGTYPLFGARRERFHGRSFPPQQGTSLTVNAPNLVPNAMYSPKSAYNP